MYLPATEYWFSGPALIGAFASAYALGLGVIGIKEITPGGYRVAVCLLLPLMLLQWWSVAWQEAEKATPEHHWVYLKPTTYIAESGAIYLATVATGTLRNVRIAAQRVGPDGLPEQGYVYSNGIDGVTVDKGENLSQVFLLPGSYDLDVDPPTEFGKVKERLSMVREGDQIIGSVRVVRKNGGEVLIPAPPARPFDPKIAVGLALLGTFFVLGVFWELAKGT